MASIDVKQIQQNIERIVNLRQTIEDAGSIGRTKLESLKVDDSLSKVVDATGIFDQQKWDALSDKEKGETSHGLEQIRDSLTVAAGQDGPTDPGHIMHATYASNRAIVVGAGLAFLLIGALLYFIVEFWGQATGTDLVTQVQAARSAIESLEKVEEQKSDADAALVAAEEALRQAKQSPETEAQIEATRVRDEASAQVSALSAKLDTEKQQAAENAIAALKDVDIGGVDEKSIFMMVVLLGALGGSLHFIGSFVSFVGNRMLMRSWLVHYISMPVVGAALAPIVYMLLRVGLIAPTGTESNGSSTSSLNLIGIYAFAALTGLFAGTAKDKLAEVFRTLFRTDQKSRDPLSSGRPPGDS